MLLAGLSTAVLGAAGFIGRALADRLDQEGIKCERYTRMKPFLIDGELAAGVVTADVVFWLVSSIRPATATASGKAVQDLTMLRRLLELLAERSGPPPRILAVSSGGTVYDSRLPPPYSESSPTRGVNDYGESMLAVENLIRALAGDHVVLRASNAYGPGQPARRRQGVIAHWLDSIRREEPIQVIGDPATRRDYVYIEDLVDALLAAADAPGLPGVLNVGSGTGTSLAELLELLPEIVEREIEVEYSPARSFDAPSTWVDVTLARECLGFEASVPLDVGLRHTWRWLQRDEG